MTKRPPPPIMPKFDRVRACTEEECTRLRQLLPREVAWFDFDSRPVADGVVEAVLKVAREERDK